jgi:outer membrane receptor protein involved in Fe transport
MIRQFVDRFRVAMLALAGFAAILTVPGGTAVAQDDATVEEIQVTGSRIRRDTFDSASPISVMDSNDIDRSGLSAIGDLLQEMPIAGASLNQNSSAGTAHGTSSINLRNLGSNRVLVLVDGRRWVNGAGTRGFRDFVDLNTIPLAAVERIEVLKDGASAIYGSDAIAGVVNIITRKDVDGLELKLYTGSSSEGDGQTKNVSLTLGSSNERSSTFLNVSFVDGEPIYTEDRKFSAVPLNALSTTTAQGRYRLGPSDTARYTLIDGADGTDASDFRLFSSPGDLYNGFYHNYLVGPRKLANLFAQSRYEVTDTVTAVVHAMYNKRKSDQLFSEVAPRVRGSDGMLIPADHPYNPFGVELSGSSFEINRVLTAMGQRDNVQEVDTFRAGLALEGEAFGDWNWDIGYAYSENDATFSSLNQINVDRLAVALGPNARCAATQGCVPFNIFGDASLMTDAMLDYVRVDAKDRNGTSQDDFTANITGDLFSMPAGAVGFAAGFEHRRERAYDTPDGEVNAPPVAFDPANDRATSSAPRIATDGEYDLDELYVEFSLPLLDSLELDIAARYSDYSSFGDTTNGKFGLSYRPTDSLQLRATYAEGFRAPSIIELYAGARATNLPALDPCSDMLNSGASATVIANCTAQGVPASGIYVQNTNAVSATVGANPLLQPEESESVTFGIVYQPGWNENLNFAVDWYDIDITDTITSLGTQRILDECASFNRYCNLIARDRNTGEILNVIDGGVNIGGTQVSGVDFVARYEMPNTSVGSFTYTFDMAYLSEYVLEIRNPDGTTSIDHLEGKQLFRENYARVKANASVEWLRDSWDFSWSGRYVDGTKEDSDQGKVDSVFYNDLQGSYHFDRYDTRLTLGIDNIFDEDPPISLVNSNINFDIQSFNPVGTFYYLRLTSTFN